MPLLCPILDSMVKALADMSKFFKSGEKLSKVVLHALSSIDEYAMDLLNYDNQGIITIMICAYHHYYSYCAIYIYMYMTCTFKEVKSLALGLQLVIALLSGSIAGVLKCSSSILNVHRLRIPPSVLPLLDRYVARGPDYNISYPSDNVTSISPMIVILSLIFANFLTLCTDRTTVQSSYSF